MEDSIEMILQDHAKISLTTKAHPVVSACTGALLAGLYGVWSLFALPGFRKVPWKLKVLQRLMIICLFWSKVLHAIINMGKEENAQDEQENMMIRSRLSEVCRAQTLNTMKLLEGRTGRLADLGSGDGRLVFAASSAGFQCTGYEINSILVAYAKSKARWTGVPTSQATFVKKDFWGTDLSSYNNVTAFLAPGVMWVLGEKLLKELPDDARVISCRFPFPDWPQQLSVGSGLDQTFAYDISSVRSHLRKTNNTVCVQ